MNFQQLRAIRETVRHSFNLTEAANALFASQSGVSRHIRDLEDEIGVALFVRRGKRLLGLTEPGKELIEIVERMLLAATSMKRIGEQFGDCDHGQLTVATTHTQARYVLPPVIAQFKKAFPKVELVLHQASPSEIASMLNAGAADIGIATGGFHAGGSFATFPYHTWYHGVMVPAGHPLTRLKSLTLAALARWPIITYTDGLTGRARIDEAFAKAGLVPDIVMSALDADVIKSYVELGLGVGIVAALAFDAQKDAGLRLIRCEHLFEANLSRIAIRHGAYQRGYAYRFIELCSPALTEAVARGDIAVINHVSNAKLEGGRKGAPRLQ